VPLATVYLITAHHARLQGLGDLIYSITIHWGTGFVYNPVQICTSPTQQAILVSYAIQYV
jgi:hypothetical protein